MKLKFYVIIALIVMTLTTNDMRAQNSTTGFSGKRVSRSATISLHGPLDKVFTLFEPEPEKKWADGWDFTPIYSKSGKAEELMMFQVTGKHDSKSLWIITKYDLKNRNIQYTVYRPTHVTVITINCTSGEKNTTNAAITYIYTGLIDEGNGHIEELANQMYARNMKDWEEAINHYLETGRTKKN